MRIAEYIERIYHGSKTMIAASAIPSPSPTFLAYLPNINNLVDQQA